MSRCEIVTTKACKFEHKPKWQSFSKFWTKLLYLSTSGAVSFLWWFGNLSLKFEILHVNQWIYQINAFTHIINLADSTFYFFQASVYLLHYWVHWMFCACLQKSNYSWDSNPRFPRVLDTNHLSTEQHNVIKEYL